MSTLCRDLPAAESAYRVQSTDGMPTTRPYLNGERSENRTNAEQSQFLNSGTKRPLLSISDGSQKYTAHVLESLVKVLVFGVGSRLGSAHNIHVSDTISPRVIKVCVSGEEVDGVGGYTHERWEDGKCLLFC